MLSSAILWPLLWAVIGSAIAVFIQRRWPYSIHSARWVAIAWALACIIASMSMIGHAPPRPWSPQALDVEPWESVLLPLVGVCLVWPLLRGLLHRWPAIRLWAVFALATAPLLASMPPADRYADLLPGNAAWVCAALLAIGANTLACERWEIAGAGRWALWVYVAQMLCVAALLLTCYGTLGEFCVAVALCLATTAIARLFTSDGVWVTAVGVPATMLSCILLLHVRDYSTVALPAWVAPLPLLMPTIVALVDARIGAGRSPIKRVAIAAAVAIGLSILTLASVLSQGSSS